MSSLGRRLECSWRAPLGSVHNGGTVPVPKFGCIMVITALLAGRSEQPHIFKPCFQSAEVVALDHAKAVEKIRMQLAGSSVPCAYWWKRSCPKIRLYNGDYRPLGG